MLSPVNKNSEVARIEAELCQHIEPWFLGALLTASVALVIMGSLALPARMHSLPWVFFTKIPMDQSILMLCSGTLGLGLCFWRLKPPKPKIEFSEAVITQIEDQLKGQTDKKLYYYPKTNTVEKEKGWWDSREDRLTLLQTDSGNYYAKTDKELGKGVQKTAYIVKGIQKGASDQVRTVERNPPENHELAIYKALQDCPYVVHCLGIPKDNEEKRTLILELCPIVLKDLKTFTEAQILTLFEEYLRGLAALHESGYLHLDCHRGNLYIDAKGHGRLADFGSSRPIASLNTNEGFARMMPDASGSFTLPMAAALLAPEIVIGFSHFTTKNPNISGKADVWALGNVLGWLLKNSIKAQAYEHVTNLQKQFQPNADKFKPFALKTGERETYCLLLESNYPFEPDLTPLII